ncbi:MAG: glycosyltransferase family 4 protein [Candidatus Marinimicrobia bacterium]|nr:glycosyltransferase family 4 protein [Candidatus Neomarinimicrobiota bacterium]
MKTKKVLVITHVFSTFVQRDVAILEKKFKVKCHTYDGEKDLLSNFFAQIKLKIWLLRHIWTAYAVYIWFADYHAFLPVLFARIWRKKSFIVEGGYDTISLPELKYGSHVNPLRSKMSTFAMKHATLNLPVCETLIPEIKAIAPQATVQCLYTGYDAAIFTPGTKKEKIVLTVAGGNTLQRIRLKGVDIFIQVAQNMPEYRFIIVGIEEEGKNYLGQLPENVFVIGKTPQKELITYYQKASIYAQFSMREGLPNAVCEAMMCKCVPVGFDAGGISVAIGDAGYIIKDKTISQAVSVIRAAIDRVEELGPKARERIIKMFPQQLREKKLLDILENPENTMKVI